MNRIINIPLLSHPMNWLVVWTVLLFGAVAWHMILSRVSPPASEDTSATA